jgi:hypothetical protein
MGREAISGRVRQGTVSQRPRCTRQLVARDAISKLKPRPTNAPPHSSVDCGAETSLDEMRMEVRRGEWNDHGAGASLPHQEDDRRRMPRAAAGRCQTGKGTLGSTTSWAARHGAHDVGAHHRRGGCGSVTSRSRLLVKSKNVAHARPEAVDRGAMTVAIEQDVAGASLDANAERDLAARLEKQLEVAVHDA